MSSSELGRIILTFAMTKTCWWGAEARQSPLLLGYHSIQQHNWLPAIGAAVTGVGIAFSRKRRRAYLLLFRECLCCEDCSGAHGVFELGAVLAVEISKSRRVPVRSSGATV